MNRNAQVARSLDDLALPSGRFAMVAIDQRESLRAMFRAAGGPGDDEQLADFKTAVVEVLGSRGSAILVDAGLGLDAARAVAQTTRCGLILAADVLEYGDDGAVVRTGLDDEVLSGRAPGLPSVLAELAPRALKLLLLWDEAAPEEAERLASDFITRCREAGVVSLLEVKVRAPTTSAYARTVALVKAAERLAPCQPDVYKTEVPFFGDGSERAIIEVCEQITQALPCPWVVLSSGVPVDRFAQAVALSCRGGASGFLAGRGVWSEAVQSTGYRRSLESTAVPRLQRLVEVVEA